MRWQKWPSAHISSPRHWAQTYGCSIRRAVANHTISTVLLPAKSLRWPQMRWGNSRNSHSHIYGTITKGGIHPAVSSLFSFETEIPSSTRWNHLINTFKVNINWQFNRFTAIKMSSETVEPGAGLIHWLTANVPMQSRCTESAMAHRRLALGVEC